MLRRIRDLEGFEVWSRNRQDLGRVEDFYFDETRWTVRYVVVKTGAWLTGRSVLLSPMTISRLEWNKARVDFRLSADQIERAPDADLARPISRAWEANYSTYYGLPYYWVGSGVWGMWATPIEAGSATGTVPPADMPDERGLRSIREVTGYHIEALDGEIGHVEDFLTDDESWRIKYLMIDTSNWIGGRTVLIAPEWASRIDWVGKKVHLDVTRAVVESSPEYDPGADIDGKYEERLAESFHIKRT